MNIHIGQNFSHVKHLLGIWGNMFLSNLCCLYFFYYAWFPDEQLFSVFSFYLLQSFWSRIKTDILLRSCLWVFTEKLTSAFKDRNPNAFINKINTEQLYSGCRDVLALKSIGYSSRESEFESHNSHGSYQLSVPPVSGNPVSSSGLSGHQTCMWCIDTHSIKILIHMKINYIKVI